MHTLEWTVERVWAQIARGEKVDVPAAWVEHPADRPDLFRVPSAALATGQTCDYVWQLPDGGRVHAQCFRVRGQDTVRFHLDRWDPERGVVDWVAHGLFETPLGPALGIAAVALAFVAVSQLE